MKEFTMTINLIQGDPIRFKIKRTTEEVRNVGTHLESGLQARYFGVELNGKLVIVPFHNIRSIEIDPSPGILVAHVLRDAKPVD
jgi:hypothetical protein